MATSRKRPNRNSTASARKRGRGGSFEKRVKQFWKQNKTLIKGGLQFLLIALGELVIAIPFMRVDNPGNTYGIDVSSHNGTVRWDEVSENGVQFAVIRAGARTSRTGEIYRDTQFKRNMRRAWFHHVDRGVYFYSQAINEEEAREEAEAVLKCLSGANLKLPVFYDIEDTGTEGKGRADGLSRAQRTANALAFAEVIAEEGYTPGVYANRWYLTSELDADALRNAGVSIWLAEYTNNERPAYREAYDYWQYSKTGRVPGIDGDADLDRVYA